MNNNFIMNKSFYIGVDGRSSFPLNWLLFRELELMGPLSQIVLSNDLGREKTKQWMVWI